MKKFVIAAIVILSQDAFAQNCFQTCRDHLSAPLGNNENLEKRLEKSERVLQDLVGCKSPDFKVTSIEGELLDAHELRDKVIVLNFWFQACTTCISEITLLNQLVKEYKQDDVVFIAFARDSEIDIRSFLKTTSFNYQIVSSQYDLSEKFCVIGGWPMNMIIDKRGTVQYVQAGGFVRDSESTNTYEKMKPVIDKYLK